MSQIDQRQRLYGDADMHTSAAGAFGPPDITPGLYHDLPNESYHRAPGISNSGLGLIARAPRVYYGRVLDPNRPPETERGGQLEGTLAHCAILEPEAFDERYVVGPTVNRNTKEWKAFVAAHPSKVAIQQPQRDAAFAQRAAVLEITDVAEALARGRPEVSAFWRDPGTEELCKCRPDWVASFDAGDILLDVKTYSSAEPGEFARQIARKGYYRQAAFYSEGWARAAGRDVLGFIFVAVETEHPYCASAEMLDNDSLDAGAEEVHRLLGTYATCRRTGRWPGYSDAVEVVRLPNYILNREG